VLFFYFLPDTTRDYRILSLCIEQYTYTKQYLAINLNPCHIVPTFITKPPPDVYRQNVSVKQMSRPNIALSKALTFPRTRTL
jgi:hypothetical protein